MFWMYWLIGAMIVFIEGACAYHDGFLTQGQIAYHHHFPKAWSFMEHAGMWCDLFLVSPLVAMIISKYELAYSSWQSIVFIALSIAITLYFNHMYNTKWLIVPEAGRHDGAVTTMGKIHGLYAVVTMWIIFLFYFCPVTPEITKSDLLKVFGALLILFFVGITKFSTKWEWRRLDSITVATECLITIGVTYWKYQHLSK